MQHVKIKCLYFQDKFGNATLKDFHSKCIAGATARSFHTQDWLLDEIELFDTRSDISYKATEVVLATTNCHVMFPCPQYVGENAYIDGALGGNSALPDSVARLQSLKPNARLT